MTKTQDLGISQLPNGNWCYRFTKTVDGKRVNRKGSKDEAGNPLKTKRAAAQAKAIAEIFSYFWTFQKAVGHARDTFTACKYDRE